MKGFIAKLDLTPKKFVVYLILLFLFTAAYITAVVVLFSSDQVLYNGQLIVQNYFVNGKISDSGTPFRTICNLIFLAIYLATVISVFVVFLLRYLKNTNKIKTVKNRKPLKIALLSILSVLFIAVVVASILLATNNIILNTGGAESSGSDGFEVFNVLNKNLDPQIRQYFSNGRPIVTEYGWSNWYYWFYWSLLPLIVALFAGTAAVAIFGFILPAIKNKKAGGLTSGDIESADRNE